MITVFMNNPVDFIQLTLQSQSQTGGFQKPRDVVSNNTYEKVINDYKDLKYVYLSR